MNRFNFNETFNTNHLRSESGFKVFSEGLIQRFIDATPGQRLSWAWKDSITET